MLSSQISTTSSVGFGAASTYTIKSPHEIGACFLHIELEDLMLDLLPSTVKEYQASFNSRMSPTRRSSSILLISVFVLFPPMLYLMLRQHTPLMELLPSSVKPGSDASALRLPNLLGPILAQQFDAWANHTKTSINDDIVPDSNYTRILVVPQTSKDSIDWIDKLALNVDLALYVVDNPTAASVPPVNKGHEVMVYLTYIIDHYEQLPDIIIFMHAHRHTWHNVDLLGFDAAEMVKRLNSERVVRYGYMNLRCAWEPGCPVWLHPHKKEELLEKQEQILLAKSWSELFPLDPLPTTLGQPCCAQFAVSKERILSIPYGRFVFYRDWLFRTPLTDYFSGRIWEFVWQYVFTGQEIFCPQEHACYCDGYGICFGGRAQYGEFLSLRHRKDNYTEELATLVKKQRNDVEATQSLEAYSNSNLDKLDLGREAMLTGRIKAIEAELHSRKIAALDRGATYRNRAAAAESEEIE